MAKPDDEYKFPDEQEAKGSEAADNLSVEIEDDTPAADRGRKPMKEAVEDPSDDELESYDEKVQARIKKFTRGYHDERRAKEQALREREAAENYARAIIEENKKLQERLASSSKAYIATSKNAAESQLVAAKERYKKAYESGDPDAVTEAQEQLAKATVAMDKVANMRPITVKEPQAQYQPAPQQEAPQAPTLDKRTRRWAEANSDWWGVDKEMTAAALGLDAKLAEQYGNDYIGSKEYFRAIDKTMRKRFPEYFDTRSEDEDDEPPQRERPEPASEEKPERRAQKPATVVAPATRSTSPTRIKLKSSQAAIARRLGVSLEEYAKQVARIERGG